jgi:hypothetical protein
MNSSRCWIDSIFQELDLAVKKEADQHTDAVRLMEQSGVGPVTALAFVLTIGPIDRFSKSKQVVSYLGLNPTECSSGGQATPRLDQQTGQREDALFVGRGRARGLALRSRITAELNHGLQWKNRIEDWWSETITIRFLKRVFVERQKLAFVSRHLPRRAASLVLDRCALTTPPTS